MIGLTSAEEELYRCLLQLTTARIDELVRRLHRPREQVVAQVEALRGRAWCSPPTTIRTPAPPDRPDVALGGRCCVVRRIWRRPAVGSPNWPRSTGPGCVGTTSTTSSR
ncbi:hypothetical protein NKG94_17730 [Micromonospora sp. M12]